MLLPWYVTGRLDAADRERVDRYVAAHPDMAAQLDLVQEEMGETIVSNEMLGGAPAGALGKLRAAIAAEPKRVTVASVRRSIWAEFARLLTAPTPRAVQWAGAAAVVLVVAQAAVIGGLVTSPRGPAPGSNGATQVAKGVPQGEAVTQMRPQSSARFRTASGQSGLGTRVQVRFADDATAAKLAAFLRSERIEIVSGPKPGGYFEVRVSKTVLSDAEREAAIAKLEAEKGLVKEVLK